MYVYKLDVTLAKIFVDDHYPATSEYMRKQRYLYYRHSRCFCNNTHILLFNNIISYVLPVACSNLFLKWILHLWKVNVTLRFKLVHTYANVVFLNVILRPLNIKTQPTYPEEGTRYVNFVQLSRFSL
jgi:hypothetical protein